MSPSGLVSRVTPVHTAVRNCTRDEGRSFEVGNQVLKGKSIGISSHCRGFIVFRDAFPVVLGLHLLLLLGQPVPDAGHF
jgi:hypothetical protein